MDWDRVALQCLRRIKGLSLLIGHLKYWHTYLLTYFSIPYANAGHAITFMLYNAGRQNGVTLGALLWEIPFTDFVYFQLIRWHALWHSWTGRRGGAFEIFGPVEAKPEVAGAGNWPGCCKWSLKYEQNGCEVVKWNCRRSLKYPAFERSNWKWARPKVFP